MVHFTQPPPTTDKLYSSEWINIPNLWSISLRGPEPTAKMPCPLHGVVPHSSDMGMIDPQFTWVNLLLLEALQIKLHNSSQGPSYENIVFIPYRYLLYIRMCYPVVSYTSRRDCMNALASGGRKKGHSYLEAERKHNSSFLPLRSLLLNKFRAFRQYWH